jgi:hypothetical protein
VRDLLVCSSDYEAVASRVIEIGTLPLTRIPKLAFGKFPLFADLPDSRCSPGTVGYLCRPEARTTKLWCRRPRLLPSFLSGPGEEDDATTSPLALKSTSEFGFKTPLPMPRKGLKF